MTEQRWPMWVIALLLAAYGAFAGQVALRSPGPMTIGVSALAFLGAGGLLAGQPWSRFVVYAVAAFLVGTWAYAVAWLAWYEWPYPDAYTSAVALGPGFLLLVLCVVSCVVVARHFRSS